APSSHPFPSHAPGSAISADRHPPFTHVWSGAHGTPSHAARSGTSIRSSVCGTNRIARRATMQPLPYGGAHVPTSRPTPAITLNATSSDLPPLGTTTSSPRSWDASHVAELVVGALPSMSPSRPTVMLDPPRLAHGTSVETTSEISVGVRQLANSAATRSRKL